MSPIHLGQVIDSEETALALRMALDIPRELARDLGSSAVKATWDGYYFADGKRVLWGVDVDTATNQKRSIPPDEILPKGPQLFDETRVDIANETTLGAAARLANAGERPLALNFANGIHPGGGFLNGARAQEEFLCRSSALYKTLVDDPMYDAHRARPLPDSTAWTIFSPDVPVFRTDGKTEIPVPWKLSFLTCAAPVARSVGRYESRTLLRERIERVLEIASALEYKTLILGAWGCGAFGNDPTSTAEDFRSAIERRFDGCFSTIIFAITDWSPERRTLGPFRDVFSG